MDRDQAPCLACDAAVPGDARTCPDCGYDVDRHDRRRRWLGGVGTGLTLSLVLAPVGLPLLWLAHRHRLAVEGTVTRRAEPSLGENLRSGIADFLALERGRPGARDFRRGGRPAVQDVPDPRRR